MRARTGGTHEAQDFGQGPCGRFGPGGHARAEHPPRGNTPPPPQPHINLDACGAPGLPAAREKAAHSSGRSEPIWRRSKTRSATSPSSGRSRPAPRSVEQIAAVVAEEYSIIRSDMHSFTSDGRSLGPPHGSHFLAPSPPAKPQPCRWCSDLRCATSGSTSRPSRPTSPGPRPRPTRHASPDRLHNADRASAVRPLFLVNFAVFGENMARLRHALIGVYGFAPEAIAFFTFFAEPIPAFEDDALEVIPVGLIEGACPRDVRRQRGCLRPTSWISGRPRPTLPARRYP